MKFQVSNKKFKNIIRQAAAQVTTKSDRPILSQARLLATPGEVRLDCNNTEMIYSATLPAYVDEPGVATLPASELSAYLSGLGEVDLQFDTAGPKLRLRRGELGEVGEFSPAAGETLLDQYPVEDFPAISWPGHEAGMIEVRAGALKNAIEATAFAVDKEPPRPGLDCLRFSLVRGALRLGAASNASLALMDVPLYAENGETFDNMPFLLPAPSCNQLASLLPEDEDDLVEIYLSDNRSYAYFYFKADQAIISVGINIMAVNAIDFERMLTPIRSNPYNLVVNREALVKALRRVLVFTEDKTNRVVIMTVEPKEPVVGEPPSPYALINLYGRSEQRFETEEMVRAVSYNGERVEIGLHISKMLEVLARFEGVTVELLLAGGNKPILIRPVINRDAQQTVLMPLIFSQRPAKTSINDSQKVAA
jgi:DNA polymerase-3 subunit beta